MIKRVCGLFLFVSGFFVLPNFSYSSASSVHDLYWKLDSEFNFSQMEITWSVQYDSLLSFFENYCTSWSLEKAKKDLPALIRAWNMPIKRNKEEVLLRRFSLLKTLIEENRINDDKKFCNNEYLLYSLLNITKESYLWKNSTYTTQNTFIIWKYENSASSKNDIFNFHYDTSWLPLNVRNSFQRQTNTYLQNTIYDMFNRWILSSEDISVLNNKIKVSYLYGCEDTEWSFNAVKNLDTNEVMFSWINLIISYCSTNDTQERNKRHVVQILAHEIWHYIYYFKDKHPSLFSEICWNEWVLNCLPKDFVSSYALVSDVEDYAESFAYRYCWFVSDSSHWSAPLDNPISRRERYFRRLFEEIEEEDDDDNPEDE